MARSFALNDSSSAELITEECGSTPDPGLLFRCSPAVPGRLLFPVWMAQNSMLLDVLPLPLPPYGAAGEYKGWACHCLAEAGSGGGEGAAGATAVTFPPGRAVEGRDGLGRESAEGGRGEVAEGP